MKAKPIEQLEISRVWTVSTVHISGSDSRVLSQIADLPVLEYPEGFWLTVPDAEELDAKFIDRLCEVGLSPAVGHILSVAGRQAVEFVRIDADGPIYSFLPQFHW